jgi:hypothetical protein
MELIDGSSLAECVDVPFEAFVSVFDHGREAQFSSASTSSSRSYRVGCFAKTLTASLLANACAEGKLSLDQEVGRYLCVAAGNSLASKQLHALRIGDLFTHSHGLDDSLITESPRHSDGRIDVQSLQWLLTQHPPLSKPNSYFSYSNAAIWMAAGILECCYDATYWDLVNERLLKPLGIEPSLDAASGLKEYANRQVCAAIGSNLSLQVSQVLALTHEHMRCTDPSRNHAYKMLRDWTFSPKGWQPISRVSCIGWNYYADGWFGHNAQYGSDSLVVRFNIAADQAVVVGAARPEAAHGILGKAFGEYLPEFRSAIPVPQRAKGANSTNGCEGAYMNASTSIHIDRAASGALRIRVHARNHPVTQASTMKRYLQNVGGLLFSLTPSGQSQFPFVEFVEPDADGQFQHLHNGHQVFTRVSSQAA